MPDPSTANMVIDVRPVVGLETLYWVSNLGVIGSFNRPHHPGRIMKPASDIDSPNGSKYLYVRTSHQGKRTRLYIHRTVLEAFVGPAEGRWGLHIDDNHLNNRLDNLYWGTQSDNEADMRRNGIKTRKDLCDRGHAMAPENTRVYKTIHRCRTCYNDLARARRRARKGVVHA